MANEGMGGYLSPGFSGHVQNGPPQIGFTVRQNRNTPFPMAAQDPTALISFHDTRYSNQAEAKPSTVYAKPPLKRLIEANGIRALLIKVTIRDGQ
ncbi:hypothetical protein CEXT_165141 [Caerostris extrusa]|uniref:Uncharacterized protein n=1 Tax=Caerostris extrusa TaxID=172846 RepID=A0AAV4XSH9_CAEEX|nr:hypothetical protein CEXT_165141 [Caerostris extrusa]